MSTGDIITGGDNDSIKVKEEVYPDSKISIDDGENILSYTSSGAVDTRASINDYNENFSGSGRTSKGIKKSSINDKNGNFIDEEDIEDNKNIDFINDNKIKKEISTNVDVERNRGSERNGFEGNENGSGNRGTNGGSSVSINKNNISIEDLLSLHARDEETISALKTAISAYKVRIDSLERQTISQEAQLSSLTILPSENSVLRKEIASLHARIKSLEGSASKIMSKQGVIEETNGVTLEANVVDYSNFNNKNPPGTHFSSPSLALVAYGDDKNVETLLSQQQQRLQMQMPQRDVGQGVIPRELQVQWRGVSSNAMVPYGNNNLPTKVNGNLYGQSSSKTSGAVFFPASDTTSSVLSAKLQAFSRHILFLNGELSDRDKQICAQRQRLEFLNEENASKDRRITLLLDKLRQHSLLECDLPQCLITSSENLAAEGKNGNRSHSRQGQSQLIHSTQQPISPQATVKVAEADYAALRMKVATQTGVIEALHERLDLLTGELEQKGLVIDAVKAENNALRTSLSKLIGQITGQTLNDIATRCENKRNFENINKGNINNFRSVNNGNNEVFDNNSGEAGSNNLRGNNNSDINSNSSTSNVNMSGNFDNNNNYVGRETLALKRIALLRSKRD